MFKNLLLSVPIFRHHNFSAWQGELRKEKDPSWDCELAGFRLKPGYDPDPLLLETLSCTLSPECYASFIRANPDLPITERDYYLSKLFQFLFQTVLDEGNTPEEDDVGGELALWLDEALPEASALWKNLSKIDWRRFFAAYRDYPMKQIIADIASYLPAGNASLEPNPVDGPQTHFANRRRPDEKVDDFIDRRRKECNFQSIDELAHVARMSPDTIYQIKNGKSVRSENLKALARALMCLMDDLS